MADDLILAAAHAHCEGPDDGTRLRSLIDTLLKGWASSAGGNWWRGGLAPCCRAASHKCSTPAGLTMRSAVSSAVGRVPRLRQSWRARLLPVAPRHRRSGGPVSVPWQAKSVRKLDPASSSWRADLSTAIAALSVIGHLPALADLGDVSSRTRNTGSHEQERLFTRIRGLLTKAESSDFAEEADAFMTKAQELMTRYCIDRTMVEADAEGDGRFAGRRTPCVAGGPVSRSEGAPPWPTSPSANRCRAVVDREFGFSTLVGHPGDLDATDLLFTSLLVQATRRITALGNDPTLRPAFSEAVVSPIVSCGVRRKDRFSPPRGQRGRDRGGRRSLGQPPPASAGPTGGKARCRCRSGLFRRVEKAGVLAHGCCRVGGRHGGGGRGRARGSTRDSRSRRRPYQLVADIPRSEPVVARASSDATYDLDHLHFNVFHSSLWILLP